MKPLAVVSQQVIPVQCESAVDPFECGELDRLGGAPGSTPVDHRGLEEAVDRLGEGIVVAVADTADRRLDVGLGKALRIFDRDALGGFKETPWADSNSRRNTMTKGVAMNNRKRRSDRSRRAPLRSPGRPPMAGRDEQRRFWAAIASGRSEEHTSELQSLMRISYAVFSLKTKNNNN